MIKLRPWKGSKNEFEVDIIVNGPQGRSVRKRVKAPVTGKSNAERWAKALEQELLTQLLAPEAAPDKPPAPRFDEFAPRFLDLCKADRLGVAARKRSRSRCRPRCATSRYSASSAINSPRCWPA